MKPLFRIAVTLSVLWLTNAAPQPLSLINTTISEINDLTTATISELVAADNSQSTLLPTTNKPDSSTDSGDGSSVSVNAREESDFSKSDEDAMQGTTSRIGSDSTESKSTDASDDVTDALTSTGTTFSKPAEHVEIVSESDVPITRYVPPLDPMKHMLMMADVKGIPSLSNLMPKINFKPEISTTDVSTNKDLEPEVENVSTENSDILEKVIAESSEVEENHEKLVTEKSVTESPEKASTLSTEKVVDESSEKVADEITESVDDNSSEKIVTEASEVEENLEKFKAESTVSDIVSSSTVLLKSDDLNPVADLESETSIDHSSTPSIPTSTNVRETTLDTTVKAEEVSETSALHRNSETVLNSEETTESEKEMSEIENETTAAVFTSTEEAIKVDDTTNSDNLLKNAEVKSETSFSENETTTSKSVTSTQSDIKLKNSEISTTKGSTDVISTTSTTVVPETTFESSTAVSESEKKNISLEDELEFRAVKIPLNTSKVSYIEYEPIIPRDPAAVEANPESDTEIELTTSNIFTTIADFLFSSSTTEIADNLIEESKEESSTSLTEQETQSTELPLSVGKISSEAESDSGTVLANDPADMLKVQSVTAELDSVPARETSTLIPSTERLATEIPPEEMLDDESEVDGEKLVDESAQTVINSATTTVSSSTTDELTTKINPTVTELSTTTESELQNLEHKNSETFESESEIQNDSTSEEKPSDYLTNIQNRYISGENRDMVAAVQFLHYHDKASSEQCFKLVDAHWNYATNLTEENKKKQLEQTLQYSLFHKEAWKNATSFAWKSFNDTLLRRWFKSLSVLGTAALPEDKLNEFNKLKAEMKNTYSTAKICTYIPLQSAKKGQILTEKDCNLTLEPDLQRILTKSRDYDELVHVWKSWRDAAGKPIREKYLRFVELSNEAARMNGFSDTGDMWREAYESETFEADLENIWEQLRPLYEHLHAYVRRRLIQQYGSDKIKEDGPIPAHLFGNMWAQSWVSLLDITQPFPGKPSVDVTPIMEAKNMTPYEMFKISEEFFTSLGLKAMPEPFWEHSLIEKPTDREIICHASAWDFCNGKDYRIKQCTDITMEDLITVHHEMGHIQYFLQYARQPNVFREGANPGFHEAIGDVLALSVSTPKHLKSIGLLDEVADDPEGDLNFLLYTALDKVSFLPSGYLIDLWRWGLFSGDIKPEEMNSRWWELRLKYQGVCPPVKRTDTDFDPGAKFHVPGNVPYIRYFVSFVIQFQFHKVLCDAAGHTGPLYKCDIYRSKEAGQILSQVMELGSSEHWSEAMKIMTGGATNKMDAGPILEYFDPLLEFLKEQNQNETIGWRSSDPTLCP